MPFSGDRWHHTTLVTKSKFAFAFTHSVTRSEITMHSLTNNNRPIRKYDSEATGQIREKYHQRGNAVPALILGPAKSGPFPFNHRPARLPAAARRVPA